MLDPKNDPSTDDNTDLLSKFDDWDRECDAHWSAWRDETRMAYGFVAGEQWDKEDAAAMKESGRAAVVFNRVGPILDSVIGAEIQGRQQVQYLPRQVEAAGPNEVLSKGAEWIRDLCDAETEESDAFRDALICGLGWTETRMDYEQDPEGRILIERIDPLELVCDPRAKKSNLVDARYLRRARPYAKAEFQERWPDAEAGGADEGPDRKPTVLNDPRGRYGDDDLDGADDDTVVVKEYQWFELERAHTVELAGQVDTLNDAELEALQQQLKAKGLPEAQSVKAWRRLYRRAFVCGREVLEEGSLPDAEFTLKAITGKRDRNRNVWYGLVRPMIDPQRWANKFFSQALHILNTNAKGGLLAEEGAFADARQAEESWAKADSITWARPGALSGGAPAIQPKLAPPMPSSIGQLMQWSVSAIRETTGVNEELLGMAEREQPGVLEAQRKESAYGILAAFFDSLRRYRKLQGRLLLKYINRYLPDGTLVRILGEDGVARYIPLLKDPAFDRFDVIVDQSATGPNEKARVFAMMMQFQGMLAGAGPEILAELVRYSPLPDSLAQKLSQLILAQAHPPQPAPPPMQGPPQGPVQPPPPNPLMGLAVAEKQADIAQKQSGAQLNAAKAAKTQAEAQRMGAWNTLMGGGG
jgi:hypothetical protein